MTKGHAAYAEAEIESRIASLRPLMEKASLDGAFFHYKIDYYYLSGTMQDAFLLVPLKEIPFSLSDGSWAGRDGNRRSRRLFP